MRLACECVRQAKVETGMLVRLDSTVTAALMHEPSDSRLLWATRSRVGAAVEAADASVGGFGVAERRQRQQARPDGGEG